MRKGHCIVNLLALFILIWLVFMGGCQLIGKMTREGLETDCLTLAAD